MTIALELREKKTSIEQKARELIAKISEASEDRAKEIDTEVDRMLADADALEARAKRADDIEARSKAMEAADPRRPVAEARAVDGAYTSEDHMKAFDALLRGRELSNEQRSVLNQHRERRDLLVGNPPGSSTTAGGYLVPTVLSDQIIQSLKLYGPMMDASVVNQIRTGNGAPMQFPTLNDTANMGRLVGEAQPILTANLAFGQKTLSAYKYTSDFFKVSSEAAQDIAFDVPALLVQTISNRLGRVVNNDLTVGTGVNMPTGIATAVAAAGAPISTVANAAVSYADIISLQASVDPLYRKNPKSQLMVSDNVLQSIRKLVDSQGHPLWQPAVTAGTPDTFAGIPYVINTSLSNLASGNVVALYGDFSKYWVRVSRDITIKYTGERFIDNDEVAWVGFMRVDGQLMDPNAIRALKAT